MFSLISGLWQFFFSRPSLHILIIGLDFAGKTSILERTKSKYGNTPGLPPEKIPPTVGMNLAKLNVRGTQVIMWDLGGQIKMRSMWEKYYSEANAVIFVVDSTDIGRLEEAKLAYDSVFDHDSLNQVSVVTFANKQDLAGALSPADLAISFEPQGLGTDWKGKIFPVSAITGNGLEDAIVCVIDEAIKNARVRQR